MHGRDSGAARSSRRAATIATTVAIVGALQLAAAGPAAAIDGLQRTVESSQFSEQSVKAAIAECPAGKHVVGGGGQVYDGGRRLVRLTALYPFSSPESGDSYVAWAIAPNRSSDYDWDVTAYAVCADQDALSDYRIVRTQPLERSAGVFKAAAVACPSGTVAYGSGGTILGPGQGDMGRGQIGLQLVRTSGPMDIARATARVARSSFDEPWSVRAYAVCAARQAGIHVDGAGSLGAEVSSDCPSGYRVHGPGGGGGLTDGGPVWLQKIYPHAGLGGVDVALTGPLHPSIGGMIAHHTCAL